jgi:hypothetical protein
VASCPLAAAVLPLLVDVFRIPETIRPISRTKRHPEEQADMILPFPLFEQLSAVMDSYLSSYPMVNKLESRG